MTLRPASPSDFPAILALNLASVHFLSPLDLQRLEWLHSIAAYHRVVETEGRIVAFLLAFREGCGYDSPNYRWFSARYPQFYYVDRIVVDARQRGAGLGALLYADLFAESRRNGVSTITCEFDRDPPNDSSRLFHERFGFTEVGRQWVGEGKQVSLRLAGPEAFQQAAVAPPGASLQ